MTTPARPVAPGRRSARRLLAALLLPTLLTVVPAAPAAAQDDDGGVVRPAAVPSGYRIRTLLTGLQNPWDAAFTPGGAMFFTERVGDINLRFHDGRVHTYPRPGDVVASGEGGMMGIAVDPAWKKRRRIFVCYLTAGDVRVVRWTVSRDGRSLSGRADLITGIPRSSGRHSGCRVRFGPDRMLWVTTGDAAEPQHPQSRTSLGGKVLRIKRNGGAPRGNAGGQFLPEIYAYGFRNPQGITFRPRDGRPFLIEHGTGCDDEVTPLSPGGNGGWNPVDPSRPGFYDETVPMTDTVRYPDALRPAWRSGCPTIAPSGGTFVTHRDWGDFRGRIAMAVLKDQELRMVKMPAAAVNGGAVIITNRGRLRVAVNGPRGRLYVLTDSIDGQIFTVDPLP